MAAGKFLVVSLVIASIVVIPTSAQLTPDFYNSICPQALPTIKQVVLQAIANETRMGASLLRLHFHDCFVNGCDGSILLDDTANFTGEKTAFPNLNSVRGFEVIDKIKQAVDDECGVGKVSCADILAVAARDSIQILGGPHYKVLLGRRDATTAIFNDANSNLPAPTFNLSQLLTSFQAQGLNLTDLVALSGAHTIGSARCATFRTRVYNDSNIDRNFALSKQSICPATGGDNNLTSLDTTTPILFDAAYFHNLLESKGLLHSDQELYKNDSSDSDNLVLKYVWNPFAFLSDFKASMIKMGNLKPLTGTQGQIRLNCRTVNE